MDISGWIDHQANYLPDKVAIRFEGEDISYAALAGRIDDLAVALNRRLSVARGDRVAFLGLNSPEMIVLLFACARIGAILVPLNWRLVAREHREMLRDFTPKAFFIEPEYYAHVAEIGDATGDARLIAIGDAVNDWLTYDDLLSQTAAPLNTDQGASYDDPVLIVYTSGTTGTPKGVVLTQEALFFNAVNATHMHDMTSEDRVLTTLPMFHVGGLNIQTLPALHNGATVILRRQFDPDQTFDDLASGNISLVIFVPAQTAALIAHPRWAEADLSSVRLLITGSTFVPDHLITVYQARGIAVGNIYGCTETTPIATALMARDTDRVGSVGKAALHCDIRLVDDDGNDVPVGVSGEILVRGPNVLKEYWNNPEATAEALRDGWYHSADMAHRDKDGFIYIDDRKKDMIISGGENIYPAELEKILALSPLLLEAGVVGRDDERWGEVPVAVVVRAANERVSVDDVLALFDGSLARYKHPKDVVFVDALPRNAMGKIVKDQLRILVRDNNS
jgi:fatty-acyl-CoA synthase